MMGIVRITATVVLLFTLCSSGLLASGFENTGFGTAATGMGGAFRAIANDWTAAYYNPAGYAFVLDNQLGANLGLFHNRHELTPDYWFRDDYGNRYKNGFLNDITLFNHHEILNNPAAGFILRLPVWGETIFGLSAYQPFDYAISWKLYDPDGADFSSYNENASSALPDDQYRTDLDVVAFQLTAGREFVPDRLALGLGLQLLRADLILNDLTLRQNPRSGLVAERPRDRIPEFTHNDGMGWGFGLTGGMLWKPNEKLNLALTARLPFDITIDGTTELRFILPKVQNLPQPIAPLNSVDYYFVKGAVVTLESDMETKLKLPPSVAAGFAYDVTEKLTVALDAEYTFWSRYDGLDFTYSNFRGFDNIYEDSARDFFTVDLSRPADWSDAGKVMAGVTYAYADFLTLLCGASFDQSSMRDALDFSPQFIDTGDKYSFNGGLIAHIDNKWDVGLITGYTHCPDLGIDLNDADDDGIFESFPGEYKAATYKTSLSFNYRF